MIRIRQVKLEPNHTEKELLEKIAKTLHVSETKIQNFQIKKQSIDARKKPDIKYVYTIDAEVSNEQQILKQQKGNQVFVVDEKSYQFPKQGNTKMKERPVIIGSGPAGLFCAYQLAQHGYRPVLYERGASVEERAKDIEDFWSTGKLKTNSNVQFGEGGAGTFSDGKLNTLVKDSFGRNREVLRIFVENGAPKEILYRNKPHIGTDLLIDVVRNMRNQIVKWGGTVSFHSQMTDLTIQQGKVTSVTIASKQEEKVVPVETLVLAIGHSARDTFELLYKKQLPMTAKSFAVGVRIEHSQEIINKAQYGTNSLYHLPAAEYKVAANLKNGRGVYSFCMCPGGYVVNASSEDGHTAINGMSYHARNGKNANSAIIVTVTPEDYGHEHPLSGMQFQRELEKKTYQVGKGKIPVQRFEDFCKNIVSNKFGKILPQMKSAYEYANVRQIFPEELSQSIEEGIKIFDKQIQGFAENDVLISGVESRTSSPVRILRNENLQINNLGIYPCGEGAGYAGGITSAAMDGMKVAEIIATEFSPFDE